MSKTGMKPELDTVDPELVETQLRNRQIGERIRRLRHKKSMGLVELGSQTGLSASFLSQLETGRVLPTLRNLARIAAPFGVDLAYFFHQENTAAFDISRATDRISIRRASETAPSFFSESLSSLVSDRNFTPCLAEFELSDDDAVFTPNLFYGREFTYLLEGHIVIKLAEEAISLQQGDYTWLDASQPRTYCCPAGNHSRLMIVTRGWH